MYNFPTGLGFLPVTRNTFINVDVEKEDLLIRSNDTSRDNGDKILFRIFDETNEERISSFYLLFNKNEYTYHVGKCSKSSTSQRFLVDIPKEQDKTWRISERSDRLIVSCNSVKVLEYKFSLGVQEQCAAQWRLDASRIKFPVSHTASVSYAVEPKIDIGKLLLQTIYAVICKCTLYLNEP